MSKNVIDMMKEAQKTYCERNALYGDTYKKIGYILEAMFPEGLVLSGPLDLNRFACFVMVIGKAVRYAQMIANGQTHQDTPHDMGVYSFMLQELDADIESWLKQIRNVNFGKDLSDMDTEAGLK